MPLSERDISTLPGPEAGGKQRKHFDSDGLFLLVLASGARGWRLRYRLNGGKESMLSLGTAPPVTLAEARRRADATRALIAKGIDPAEHRRQATEAQRVEEGNTFLLAAEGYLANNAERWAAKTLARNTWLLRLVRALHAVPVSAITAARVHPVILAIQAEGDRRSTARRAAEFVNAVMTSAANRGLVSINPGIRLGRELRAVNTRHHPAIVEPAAVGRLLRDIDAYARAGSTRAALQLLPHVFVRPGELRKATWEEFDLTGATWTIPGVRMKMRRAHVVPLSTQAVAILRARQEATGGAGYLFPSGRGAARCLSDGALGAALRAMFYSAEAMSAHGFRSTASTLLNELGFDPALVELQLAHQKQDRIAAIYDRSQRLPERRAMMQKWSDYLDALKADLQPVAQN